MACSALIPVVIALITATCCAAQNRSCGTRDQLCRDAIPTQSWAANPPLPTCCEPGTTCTYISRYSRCLKVQSKCATAYEIMSNWRKWLWYSSNNRNPFSTTLAILKKHGLLKVLKRPHSKTMFAPTNEAWENLKRTEGQEAFDRFMTDKRYVNRWLRLVLVKNAVGNGGGRRVFVVGKMIVDLDLYRIVGPVNAGLLQSITSDWKCTKASVRDYVLDTETVFLPVRGYIPAPWEKRGRPKPGAARRLLYHLLGYPRL